MKVLGNLTEVTLNLSDEIISQFSLTSISEDEQKRLRTTIFNTLRSLKDKTYNKDGLTTEIRTTWCGEDVLDMDSNLTPEQVSDVLDTLKNRHDATQGINWDVITATIDAVVRYK